MGIIHSCVAKKRFLEHVASKNPVNEARLNGERGKEPRFLEATNRN